MKNVKRILALMLVVAMMLSVVSVSAFAGDRYDASLKFTFKSVDDKVITEAKKDDIVDLYVSLKTFGYANMFELVTCYDTTVLTQISAAGTTKDDKATNKNCSEILDRFASSDSVDDKDLLAHEAEMAELAGVDPNEEVIDWGSSAVTVATHKASFYPSDWDDTQKGQYKCIKFSYMADSGYSNLTINTNGEFVEMARIRFYCVEDTVLNNTTLFLSPEETASYIGIDPDDEPLANYQKNTAVDANLTVEYEGAGGSGSGSTTTPVLKMNNPKVQWKDPSNPEVLRVRFEAELTGITPTVGDDGFVNNIDRIGFKFSRTDDKLTNFTQVDSSIIYNFNDGSYKFCAITEVTMSADIINGTTASPLYASAVITVNGVETPTSVYPTTIADEYTEGVGLNLTPFPAA